MLLLAIVPIRILKGWLTVQKDTLDVALLYRHAEPMATPLSPYVFVRLMESRPRTANGYFGCCTIVLLILATLRVIRACLRLFLSFQACVQARRAQIHVLCE